MRNKYNFSSTVKKIRVLAIALIAVLPFALSAQIGVQEPSVQTGVQFFWSDTQTFNTDPATIDRVEINGVDYNTFVVPSSYQLTRLGPSGHAFNRIFENQGPPPDHTTSNDPNWANDALDAFQDQNLNHYFSSNQNGRSFCNDFTQTSTTDAQQQTLFYSPAIPSNSDGVLAVTERGGNNCYYIEVWGTPVGGGPEQILGDTFVRNSGNYTGCTFGAPNAGSDYWRSGRCNDNGQTIGIALFFLNELAPTGSSITRIVFTGATSDHGDGKFFLLQKYAVDQQLIECLDETYMGDLNILNNEPTGSTYSVVPGTEPNPVTEGTLTLNSDGTYTFVPVSGFIGDATFDYELCLPPPNTTVCDTGSVTLMYVALPPEPTFDTDCSQGNNNQTITVLSPLNVIGTNPDQYEYSIDGGSTWQSGVDFTGLGPNSYNLVVRDTYTNNCERTSSTNPIILVNDNEDPTITCPADVTVNVDTGLCTASGVNLGTPTTADNCGVANVTNDASEPFAVGETTVTWTVTDSAGNTATCEQKVTVVDNITPSISCSNATRNTDSGVCQYTVQGSEFDPTFNDNCPATLTNDLNGTASIAGEVLSVGDTAITWTVDDGNGNTAQCLVTITISDNEAPTAICQDITIQLDASGNASITTADIDNGSNDACGIQSLALDTT
ncbi:HYR domain-containing protein, partial [Hyunsoonleella rubra]